MQVWAGQRVGVNILHPGVLLPALQLRRLRWTNTCRVGQVAGEGEKGKLVVVYILSDKEKVNKYFSSLCCRERADKTWLCCWVFWESDLFPCSCFATLRLIEGDPLNGDHDESVGLSWFKWPPSSLSAGTFLSFSPPTRTSMLSWSSSGYLPNNLWGKPVER